MNKLKVPSKAIISEFKKEIWKDQRELEIDLKNNVFIKKFDLHYEIESEANILECIFQELGEGFVPKVHKITPNAIHLDHLKGIRIFNLFVDLDYLDSVGVANAHKVKRKILDRCLDRQKLIQRVLLNNRDNIDSKPYPAGKKIESIIRILSEPLGLEYTKALQLELIKFDEYWQTVACVPFRDATTKNMVLCSDELWLANFDSPRSRVKRIRDWLESNKLNWTDAPIIDFDFSSITDLTVPEDDPISLRLHQRTWRGNIFKPNDFIWLDEIEINPYRLACGLIIRYFRFGGRKLAYKLIHPRAHQTRFRYDKGEFYFERLPALVRSYSTDASNQFTNILNFASRLHQVIPNLKANVDFFLEEYPQKNTTFYTDMYPD